MYAGIVWIGVEMGKVRLSNVWYTQHLFLIVDHFQLIVIDPSW